MDEVLFGQWLGDEVPTRAGFFLTVFGSMTVCEAFFPRREHHIPRRVRWPNNLGIVVIDTLLVRAVFPAGTVGMALLAGSEGWGLFNTIAVPGWLVIVASFLLLDLTIYLQHVVFHAVPLLWRLHRMHHTDLEVDVTTGLRFHPVEILLSMVIKYAAVAALGAPVVVVLVFEVVLNATSMFNHGNVRLPIRADRILRLIVVTPDMHRVHHSVYRQETDSNFGFNLPWWDRLFGTYRAQPADGHEQMTIGLERFRSRRELRLDRLLMQPFIGSAR